jgi:uncharacterized protein
MDAGCIDNSLRCRLSQWRGKLMTQKTTQRKKIVPAILVALIALACTADYTKQIKESEQLFYRGKYLEAAKMLLPYVNKENEDQLVFMMEAGLMLHAGGDFKKSNDVFLPAGKIADNIATRVSQQAASLFLNDTVTNYKGEDFEVVLLHYYLGLNYMMMGDPENARVEFNKIDVLLRSMKETGAGLYKQNLMAKYLYGIAYETSAVMMKDENDYNDAYIEYKQVHEKMPTFDDVKLDLLRMSKKIGDNEDYNKWRAKFGPLDSKIPADAGEFILFYQSGQGAVKQSRGKIVGVGSEVRMANSINMSVNGLSMAQGVTIGAIMTVLALAENPIPKFQKRSNKINRLAVSADGVARVTTNMLEDVENTAVKNMEEQYGSMVGKVAAGLVTKIAASIAAAYLAKMTAKKLGGDKYGGILGALAGAGTGAILGANIKPDLRCWHTLPANFQVRRLFLKPGSYDMKIDLLASDGSTVETRTEKVVISAGKKTLLNFRTLY